MFREIIINKGFESWDNRFRWFELDRIGVFGLVL